MLLVPFNTNTVDGTQSSSLNDKERPSGLFTIRLYYENIEGGHGGAANNEQRAFMAALAYTFLWNELE